MCPIATGEKLRKREFNTPSPTLLYALVVSKSISSCTIGALGPGRSTRNSAETITNYSLYFGVIYFNRTDSVVGSHGHFLRIRARETIGEKGPNAVRPSLPSQLNPNSQNLQNKLLKKYPVKIIRITIKDGGAS